MKSALFLPIFDELSDPSVVVALAAEAEEAGWDGVFVWDHISYRAPVQAIADPWVTLSAIAAATSTIRIGPMVTSLPRRRPAVVARQVTTLDQLSGGRIRGDMSAVRRGPILRRSPQPVQRGGRCPSRRTTSRWVLREGPYSSG